MRMTAMNQPAPYPREFDALFQPTKRVYYFGSESAGPGKFARIEMDHCGRFGKSGANAAC